MNNGLFMFAVAVPVNGSTMNHFPFRSKFQSMGKPSQPGTGGILFVHEKSKIRMPIETDAHIFDALKEFVQKMTGQAQRVCLDVSIDSTGRRRADPVKVKRARFDR
jgi:hypothetical protein